MTRTWLAVRGAILAGAASTMAYAAGGGALSGKAYLWPYASLCNVPVPPDSPKGFRAEKDTSIGQRGCSDLEKEWGIPVAVHVHFVNTATAKGEVGHNDVSTTEIYLHVLNRGGRGVRSPLDGLL